LSAIAILMLNVAWATDTIYIFCSNEFNFIEIADRYCGSSSIMPQKKNPHSLMEVAETASQLNGALGAMMTNARSISGSIKSNLVNFDKTSAALKLWSGIVSTLIVNKEIMRQRTLDFWALATDLAGALVRERDLPWRTAHQITAILVRKALEQGKKPLDIDSEFLDQAALEYLGKPIDLGNQRIHEVLDPLRAVRARALTGGTAPTEVKRQIETCFARLRADTAALERKKQRLSDAAARLEGAIDAII
jgi:argininosuccinate lyase